MEMCISEGACSSRSGLPHCSMHSQKSRSGVLPTQEVRIENPLYYVWSMWSTCGVEQKLCNTVSKEIWVSRGHGDPRERVPFGSRSVQPKTS
jgi:hypothetical protein